MTPTSAPSGPIAYGHVRPSAKTPRTSAADAPRDPGRDGRSATTANARHHERPDEDAGCDPDRRGPTSRSSRRPMEPMTLRDQGRSMRDRHEPGTDRRRPLEPGVEPAQVQRDGEEPEARAPRPDLAGGTATASEAGRRIAAGVDGGRVVSSTDARRPWPRRRPAVGTGRGRHEGARAGRHRPHHGRRHERRCDARSLGDRPRRRSGFGAARLERGRRPWLTAATAVGAGSVVAVAAATPTSIGVVDGRGRGRGVARCAGDRGEQGAARRARQAPVRDGLAAVGTPDLAGRRHRSPRRPHPTRSTGEPRGCQTVRPRSSHPVGRSRTPRTSPSRWDHGHGPGRLTPRADGRRPGPGRRPTAPRRRPGPRPAPADPGGSVERGPEPGPQATAAAAAARDQDQEQPGRRDREQPGRPERVTDRVGDGARERPARSTDRPARHDELRSAATISPATQATEIRTIASRGRPAATRQAIGVAVELGRVSSAYVTATIRVVAEHDRDQERERAPPAGRRRRAGSGPAGRGARRSSVAHLRGRPPPRRRPRRGSARPRSPPRPGRRRRPRARRPPAPPSISGDEPEGRPAEDELDDRRPEQVGEADRASAGPGSGRGTTRSRPGSGTRPGPGPRSAGG